MKWQTYPLGRLCDVMIGATPARKESSYWGDKNIWVTVSELNDNVIQDSKEHITDLGVQNSASKLIPKGTLLFSFKLSIGKMAFAGVNLYTNEAIAALPIRPKVPLANRFLFYALRHFDCSSGAHVAVKGKLLNKRKIENLPIPLPPISEQRRIVEILDQADALRKKRAEADAKATRILPALFYKMFGDPATNPRNWPFRSLGEVTIDKPQYGANASAAEWSEGKPRYVRITDITDDGRLRKNGIVTLNIEDWDTYRLLPGDLLFARSGNTVGKTFIYREADGLCAYAGYLIRFRADPEQVEPWYLFALTQTGYYQSWVEARKRVAGQPNINGKEYASLQIPCPPTPLQQKFTKVFNELVGLRDKRGESCSIFSSTALLPATSRPNGARHT
jgi:type I restriction enzyme S subunit